MSSEYENRLYEALAGIDEEMTRIKSAAATLKNAEDKEKNLITLTTINGYISNIRKMYGNLEIIEMEGEDPDENETDSSGYADVSGFLNC